jgi:hypothetical protein
MIFPHTLLKMKRATILTGKCPASSGPCEHRFFGDAKWQNNPNSSSLVENSFEVFNGLRKVGKEAEPSK